MEGHNEKYFYRNNQKGSLVLLLLVSWVIQFDHTKQDLCD
jgi:hypothetical protein